jgi:uncharacterized protein GlcG (DUF336 family)
MTLNSQQAAALVEAAVAEGGARGLKLSVAVVDAGGYLQAFQRMDGAPLFSIQVAQGKAYGVVFMQRPSAAIRDFAENRPHMFSAVKDLGLHTLIPSPGGVPLPGGGAIGVSGALDPADDVAVADAALVAALP